MGEDMDLELMFVAVCYAGAALIMAGAFVWA